MNTDMSDFLRVEIEDTKCAIARKEQLMKLHPAPSVEASLRSFQKRLQRLESELGFLPVESPLAGCPE